MMIFGGRVTLTLCVVKSRRGYHFLKQLKRAGVSSDWWSIVFLHCCHSASVWIRMCCLAPQSHGIAVRFAETDTTNNSWWFCSWKVLRILNILIQKL